ncbi:MAG: hypothetical protein ACI3ZP_09180 [Candidatus Cryptobacteroides sp.]
MVTVYDKYSLCSENLLEVLQGVFDILKLDASLIVPAISGIEPSTLSPLARVCIAAYSHCTLEESTSIIEVLNSNELRRGAFLATIEGYANKSYLPIVGFPAQRAYDDNKAETMSAYENAAIKMFGIPGNVANCVRYVIDEIVDNISEHSGSEIGYICISGNIDSETLDVCIADNGKTLLGSYAASIDNEIDSDLEALQAANRGISTKNLPNAENRGYGITTSRNMLVTGLGGTFIMMSGEAIYLNSPNVRQFIQLPSGLSIKGTMVAIRIPYRNEKFNYINYVE